MTKEEKSRRDFLKYGAAGVAGLAIGAAGVYGMGPAREVVTTRDVTKTVRVTDTVTEAAGSQAPSGWGPPPPRSGPKVPVGVATFDDLNEAAFEKAVDDQINYLGGWSKFENTFKGKKVALKVCIHNPVPMEDPIGNAPFPVDDITKWKPPFPTKGGSWGNPHPLLVKAAAKKLNQAGATEVSLTEGNDSGGSMAFCMDVNAYDPLLADLSWLNVVDLDDEKLHMVKVPNPLNRPDFAMPDVLDDHATFNIAHISCHSCRWTSALKSWIGIQAAGWCGGGFGGQPVYSKEARAAYETFTWPQKFYARTPVETSAGKLDAGIFVKSRNHADGNNKWNELQTGSPDVGGVNSGGTYGAEIADLNTIVHQDMALVDAHAGPEGSSKHMYWPNWDYRILSQPGSSPTRGPFRVDVKLRTGHHYLIGSNDPVAADTVTVQMMGWSPQSVIFNVVAGIGGDLAVLYYAYKKGLGEGDPRMVDVKGVSEIPNAQFITRPTRPGRKMPLPTNAVALENPPAIHPDFKK
jgi:hypothetical protein